ncbi:hypothetical protein NIES2100_60650 [Calothrix sp. NIES-2100]|uniref:hypothetical protein n=1 Tax=Calothrix sp. NIES-2100 TaxID=1954172 RepID=UPI000B5E6798|nr:hypothetical protein NIES2100_60650 [Calothrix sp. NIES-2100]
MAKFKTFVTSFALCSLSLGGLVSSSFAQNKVSNQPSLQAQAPTSTSTSACPLPADIAVTFLKSECQEIQLQEAKTYYRYFSSDSNKFGRYLTTNLYKKNVEAIRELALKQEWGNQATMVLTVTVPAGTKVYQGVVAPQEPSTCYPGGGQQIFIQDSRDPNLKWSEGTPLKIKEFKCP